MASNLLVALRERGHEFIVITGRDTQALPSEDEYEGIAVYRLPFAAVLRDVDKLMRIRKEVIRLKREFAADLLHTSAVSASDFFHLTTLAAHPTPWLVSLLGAWPSGLTSLVRRALTSADWIVGCSAEILEQGRELAPEVTAHSSIIYNAQKLDPVDPRALELDPPVLLYLGRLSREKGVDVALAAFASLVERFPRIRLLIAGDGPERDTLEWQAEQLKLGSAVRFLGWVSPKKVSALINTASLVILPSRQDAFPLVALQASLMERPIVATRTGGIPEIIVDRETGLLVETENVSALAEAVSHLLEHPQSATQMGKSARGRALGCFSFERHVDAYDCLYRRIVRNWRERREDRYV